MEQQNQNTEKATNLELVVNKQNNFLVILLSVLLLFSVCIAAFFAYQTQTLVKELTLLKSSPTPMSTIVPTTEPVVTDAPSGMGTVTGKLCYPSEMLPAGEIVAKDTTTNRLYTQKFIGSGNGGKDVYRFELPAGTYKLRYMALGGNNTYTSLYYTKCSVNNSFDVCSKDENHKIILTTVKSNLETKNVDLCDMGYSKVQEEMLNNNF